MRPLQEPLASMVICGAGPNSLLELDALPVELVFPIPIVSIICPFRSLPSHTSTPTSGCDAPHLCVPHAAIPIVGSR